MATFKSRPSSPAMVSMMGRRRARAVQWVRRVFYECTETAYLESRLNMARNDERFLLVLFFCNDDALEDTEGAVEIADVVECRCLKFAGK